MREADGAWQRGPHPRGRRRHPLARFAALRAASGTRGSHSAVRGDAAPAATRPVTLQGSPQLRQPYSALACRSGRLEQCWVRRRVASDFDRPWV